MKENILTIVFLLFPLNKVSVFYRRSQICVAYVFHVCVCISSIYVYNTSEKQIALHLKFAL